MRDLLGAVRQWIAPALCPVRSRCLHRLSRFQRLPSTTLGKSCRELPHSRDSIKNGAESGRARKPSWTPAPPVQTCSMITVYTPTLSGQGDARRGLPVTTGTCDHPRVPTNSEQYSPHRVLLPSRFVDVSSLDGIRRSSHSRVSAGLRTMCLGLGKSCGYVGALAKAAMDRGLNVRLHAALPCIPWSALTRIRAAISHTYVPRTPRAPAEPVSKDAQASRT